MQSSAQAVVKAVGLSALFFWCVRVCVCGGGGGSSEKSAVAVRNVSPVRSPAGSVVLDWEATTKTRRTVWDNSLGRTVEQCVPEG